MVELNKPSTKTTFKQNWQPHTLSNNFQTKLLLDLVIIYTCVSQYHIKLTASHSFDLEWDWRTWLLMIFVQWYGSFWYPIRFISWIFSCWWFWFNDMVAWDKFEVHLYALQLIFYCIYVRESNKATAQLELSKYRDCCSTCNCWS